MLGGGIAAFAVLKRASVPKGWAELDPIRARAWRLQTVFEAAPVPANDRSCATNTQPPELQAEAATKVNGACPRAADQKAKAIRAAAYPERRADPTDPGRAQVCQWGKGGVFCVVQAMGENVVVF